MLVTEGTLESISQTLKCFCAWSDTETDAGHTKLSKLVNEKMPCVAAAFCLKS